jgi:hypothetical protein
MKRLVMVLVVAGLLAATTASGAVARTTKIEVAGTATFNHPIDPGTTTKVGSVEFVRGLVMAEDGVWNSPYLTGPEIDTINWVIDYATGRGLLWGSGHHDVTAVPGGGWDCRFLATVVDFSATGKGTCHGTGTLRTWQWRVDMHYVWGNNFTDFTGYFFEPGH